MGAGTMKNNGAHARWCLALFWIAVICTLNGLEEDAVASEEAWRLQGLPNYDESAPVAEDGQACLPFLSEGRMVPAACLPSPRSEPWCATAVNARGQLLRTARCGSRRAAQPTGGQPVLAELEVSLAQAKLKAAQAEKTEAAWHTPSPGASLFQDYEPVELARRAAMLLGVSAEKGKAPAKKAKAAAAKKKPVKKSAVKKMAVKKAGKKAVKKAVKKPKKKATKKAKKKTAAS